MADRIYLDHNATTPMRPQAITAMGEVMRMVGNASSVHGFGRAARARIDEARDAVAGLVGAFFSTGLFSMKDLHRGLSDAMGPWETALIVLQRLQ